MIQGVTAQGDMGVLRHNTAEWVTAGGTPI